MTHFNLNHFKWLVFNGTPGTVNGVYTTPIFEVKKSAINISVAPNPFRENISLKIDLEKPSELQLDFININGQILFSKEYPSGNTSENFDIQLPTLNAGMYWMRVTYEEGQLIQKLIKL